MAENEILDLTSRRWQRTRAALARSELSPAAVAERVAEYRHAQEVIATLGRLSADRLDNVSYPIQ